MNGNTALADGGHFQFIFVNIFFKVPILKAEYRLNQQQTNSDKVDKVSVN